MPYKDPIKRADAIKKSYQKHKIRKRLEWKQSYYTNLEKNRKQRKISTDRYKKEYPIRYKALNFTSKLQWGKGGTDKMEKLLMSYLNTYCKYCREKLTLENISLDHKIPLIRSKVKKGEYTKTRMKILNAETNLHFICFKCNRTKSQIPDIKYVKLLKFLNKDPELKTIILNKLRTSNLVWNH